MNEITSFATAPTPGSAKPGNLYADLQSRALWLGVDLTIEPAGSVLISDIVALQSQITTGDAASIDYTDTTLKGNSGLPIDINGYAGRVHTHTSTQITDFTAAVTTAVAAIPSANWVPGMMMIWSGSMAEVGAGDLAGWALCDGASLLRNTYPKLFGKIGVTHGSVDATHFNLPNLIDRFVLCAGGGVGKEPGKKHTVTSFSTATDGQHTHTVTGHTLSLTQIPAHGHSFSDSGTTSTGSANHDHTYTRYTSLITTEGGQGASSMWQGATSVNGSLDGAAHTHTFSFSGTTGNAGGGGSHTHGLSYDGTHDHTITDQQLRNSLPWFALAYIIKLD